MRLRIHHETHYSYDTAPSSIVQRLLLQPAEFAGQRVLTWSIDAPGITNALRYVDALGNIVHLVTVKEATPDSRIVCSGEVETQDAAGVVRGLAASVPEAVMLRMTPATRCNAAMLSFARQFQTQAPVLERAHALMGAVHQRIAYETGVSHAHTTAEEAFGDGRGVCQDHAHILIALARACRMPARYVTGYLVTGVGASAAAAHAWAEIFVADLGWVGFDAANAQCPTDHYVRIACGLDAAAVAPVRGCRRGGGGGERLTVEVRVEIAQQ